MNRQAPTPQAIAEEAGPAALLRKAQAGDRAAYGQIVLAFQDRLYNAVLRMVGDAEEARDLTQEAFVKGLAHLESFRGESGPYTWLFRIAMNLAISHLRKHQRQRIFSLDGHGDGSSRDQAAGLLDRMASPQADPLQQAEQREEHQRVLAALGRLEAQQRALLVMRDIEGFDYQEMAAVLELPLGTIKSRLFRARLALREQMEPRNQT